MNIVKSFGRAWYKFNLVLVYFAGAIIVFAVIAISVDVVMRYGFRGSLKWVDMVMGYAMVYVAFLPAAHVLSVEGHTVVDTVTTRLNEKTRAKLFVLISIAGALLCLIFLWLSLRDCWEAFRQDLNFVGIVEIPQWPILISMPMGFLFLTIEFCVRAVRFSRER